MPSPLIHSAVAVAAARFAQPSRLSVAAPALCLTAANLPDLDLIPGFLAGDPALYHHNASHSLFFALASALLLSKFAWRPGAAARPRRFLALLACSLSHPLLDLLTTDTHSTFRGAPYGMMLAWPFSSRRWLGPPIFDGAFVSNNWREWITPANFKVFGIELAIALTVIGAAWLFARLLAASPPALDPAQTNG